MSSRVHPVQSLLLVVHCDVIYTVNTWRNNGFSIFANQRGSLNSLRFSHIGVKEVSAICNECITNVLVYLLIKTVCTYDIKHTLFPTRKDVRNYRNSHFNTVNVNELIFKFTKLPRFAYQSSSFNLVNMILIHDLTRVILYNILSIEFIIYVFICI